jgi:hypothetical protein
VNSVVLSGTVTLVPSGTGSSCYRGPKSQLKRWRATLSRPRNFTNRESFGFLLTDLIRSKPKGDAQPMVLSTGIQQPCSEFPRLDSCNASAAAAACVNAARARKQLRLAACPEAIQQHGGPS